MKLSMTQCRNFEPKAKSYKKFDGGGLYLETMPNGNKLWRLKYYFLQKEKRFSLGKFPIVTLSQAREKRSIAKKLLDQGIDPSQHQKEQKKLAIRASEQSFENIAREWHNIKKTEWSDRHTRNVLHKLETNVFPFIGRDAISAITTPDLLDMLRIMEAREAYEVATRTRQICNQVFNFAIQTGRCTANPTTNLKGALKTKKTKHFAAIETKEIPSFLEALQENKARLFNRTRRAIKFSMLTFSRPGEIRQARWKDINFQEQEWIIPGEFMKGDRDHIVPLSKQALEILQEQKEESAHINTPWVFPSQVRPLKPMSDGTVNVAIKNLGFSGRMTAHGFRALARTTIREKLKYYPDIIEAQLAHKPLGYLGAAYDRAQFLDERKVMMQDWADYIDKLKPTTKSLTTRHQSF